MDPLDEFEFKPLTEGLGFHKKAERIKSEVRGANLAQDLQPHRIPEMPPRSMLVSGEIERETTLSSTAPRAASQSISDMIASLPPSLDFLETKTEHPKIYQPLSRPENKTPPPQAPSKYHERLNESFARAFPAAERTAQKRTAVEAVETGLRLHAIPCHLMAGVLDAMVVTGVSTLLMVCILAITRVNLTGLLMNAQTDGPTQLHIALLFISGLQLYLLTARSFFGSSLGEWAFDVQLGTDDDQARTVYPMLVAWRTLLLTATGLMTIPLLSFVCRRDLLKYVTGLQTYQKS